MPRATDPQVSFADWELMQQGISLDPLLAGISDLLEEHQELIEQVRVDLQRGLKRPEMGRDGLTPPQVLRSLVLMRVKNWDYRELRERIADGYTLRWFTHFYAQAVPEHHAFNRAFNRLTPAHRQHFALGYGARDHPSGATPGRNHPPGRLDVPRSHPRRQTSPSTDPTHDESTTTNSTHPKIP